MKATEDIDVTEENLRLVGLVRRFGSCTSDAVLDSASKIFSVPGLDGVIGYRKDGDCQIVYGDPICSQEDLPRLTLAFHQFCKENNTSIIYIAATENFAKWAISNACGAMIEVGQELFLNPVDDDPRNGAAGGLLRRKVRHAQHDGTLVEEYVSSDPELENAIERVGDEWLKGRQGPQVYISHVRLFDDRPGKRWFYAKQGSRIVGVVLLNRLEAYEGWLLNHLMITDDAPHGTPELLVVTTIEKLKEEGCHFVTFGAVPSKRLGEIQGLGKFASMMTRSIYTIIKRIFQLNGSKKFWEKFQPRGKASYLLFSEARIGFKEIQVLMHAMNVSF